MAACNPGNRHSSQTFSTKRLMKRALWKLWRQSIPFATKMASCIDGKEWNPERSPRLSDFSDLPTAKSDDTFQKPTGRPLEENNEQDIKEQLLEEKQQAIPDKPCLPKMEGYTALLKCTAVNESLELRKVINLVKRVNRDKPESPIDKEWGSPRMRRQFF